MPESDVPFGIKPVDALPRNVLSFVGVGRKLLDFRVVHGNRLVTCHAEADAGNSSVRPLRDSLMTACALHIVLQMNLVIEGNRLDRSGLPSYIFLQRV
jgi:hypothetical protein